MTLCGGMASSTSSSRKVDKLWRVLRDMFAKTSSRVRVNDQLSDSLGQLDKGPFDAAFDIYIDDLLDCLHECATEDAVALGKIAPLPMRTTSRCCVLLTRRPATAY
jgi:hypothetical protein